MPAFKGILAWLVTATLALGGVMVSAQSPQDPLIGTWTLNLQKSTFPGTPPKSIRRTFDYTGEDVILVTVETVNAQGNMAFLHWYMGLDGKEHPEYVRGTEPKPEWWLSTTVVDANTKQVHDRRAEGKPPQVIDYTFAVSPDGKTLTLTAKSTNSRGEPSTTISVFDKVS